MLLSELKQYVDSLVASGDKIPNGIYQVTVDKYVPEVCRELTEIGLLAEADPESPSQLSFSVMDAILSYANHGIECILEIPAEDDTLDPKMLVAVAMNCDATISVLPPQENSKQAWKQYSEKLQIYARTWLEQGNASKQLLPFSGFIAYKIQEVFGHERELMTDDPYMHSNFVEDKDVSCINSLKNDLDPIIMDYFGGQNGIESFAHSLAYSIGETLIERSSQLAVQARESETSERASSKD